MIKELQAEVQSFSSLGNLQKEVKGLLKFFVEYKIQHVYRLGNDDGHEFARYLWNVEKYCNAVRCGSNGYFSSYLA